MYGGHIINDFDRTLASTYMEFFMREELLDEMGLHPYPDTASAANTEVRTYVRDVCNLNFLFFLSNITNNFCYVDSTFYIIFFFF